MEVALVNYGIFFLALSCGFVEFVLAPSHKISVVITEVLWQFVVVCVFGLLIWKNLTDVQQSELFLRYGMLVVMFVMAKMMKLRIV